MTAKMKSGEIVTLAKDCGCINHNEPHWVYEDRLFREMNRKLLIPKEGQHHPSMMALHGFVIEDLARVQEKLRNMESRGIVELIDEPSDELTELQKRRYQDHLKYVRSLYEPEKPEEMPSLNDVRVAAKRRF